MDIPYHKKSAENQAEMHAKEMEQTALEDTTTESIIVHKLWKDFDTVVGSDRKRRTRRWR